MPRKSALKLKKQKKFLVLVVLFLVSCTFLGGLAFFKALNKPSASADSSNSFDLSSAELSTLLLITVENIEESTPKTTSLDLLIFDKKNKKVVSFDIPLNWVVNIPGKYSDNMISKVLPIAMMNADSELEAVEVLRNSIEKKFAFNIDRFIIMGEGVSHPVKETFKSGKSRGLLNYENLTKLVFSVKSDVSLSEFYSYYSFVNGLPLDSFTNYNKSAEVYNESELIQTVLRDLTFDSRVATEGSSVAVLNGTQVPGIAGFSANVLRNYGAHVTEVNNANKNYEESVLVVSSKDLEIVKQIQRFFNISKIVLKEEFSDDSFVVNKADVSLIIGLDTAEAL